MTNYKAYTIDPNAPQFGKQITLKKGDRVYGYTNSRNEAYVLFIAYECTREGGNMGYCEHCGKTVYWESLMAGYSPSAGCAPEVAHFYVPFDRESTGGYTLGNATQQAEGKSTEIVLDLNGKVLTRGGTLNKEDGKSYSSSGLVTAGYGNTLIITDFSKAQTGKLVVADGVISKGTQGLLHVQSDSKLIIEKGVFDASKSISTYESANTGLISVGGELVINGGTFKGFKEVQSANWGGTVIGSWGETSVTINGGTFEGGKAANMGGVFSINGDLTITGGKIYGGYLPSTIYKVLFILTSI